MTGLHILLAATDAAAVDQWIVQNLQWLSAETDRVSVFGLPEEGRLSVVENLVDALQTNAPVVLSDRRAASCHGDLRQLFAAHDLLCCGPSAAARDDWRMHVHRARSLAPLAAACGRWISSGDNGPSGDLNPARIAKDVTDWMFSPLMNGVAARQLPTEFVWIPREMVPMLLAYLSGTADLPAALSAYFLTVEQQGVRKCIYLPDVFVYAC